MKQWRLVESFAELRQGMVVVDVACACGCIHEVVLVEMTEFEKRESKPCEGVAWVCEPDCLANEREPDHFTGVDAGVVAQRRIFEVIDVAPATEARELAKVARR